MMTWQDSLHSGFRCPVERLRQAAWLYFRFPCNCPGTPRWSTGNPSERRSVGEFALEKLAFRSLARPQAAFCGTTWAVTKNRLFLPLSCPISRRTLISRINSDVVLQPVQTCEKSGLGVSNHFLEDFYLPLIGLGRF